ncbi:MAG: ferritin family protein [Acidobacteriota bacterium]
MDVKEALTIAIGYEHQVRDHYSLGAEQILDPKGKRVFETLAKEEQGHVAYLESRLLEWTRTGAIQPPELRTILPPPEWVAQAKERFEQGQEKDLPVNLELDLLKVALDLERKTSAFYEELVNTLPGGDRAMFSRFLEIEQGHVLIVQAEIDALAGHGHWFDFMEFQLEAG